jgi:hypothetical protein
MTLFLLMNASDLHLQNVPGDSLILLKRVLFLCQFIEPIFNGMSNELVMLLTEAFGCTS